MDQKLEYIYILWHQGLLTHRKHGLIAAPGIIQGSRKDYYSFGLFLDLAQGSPLCVDDCKRPLAYYN